MSPLIAVERLSKWYGSRLAVDRVSLEVERGEVMGLLGPNGSGKTTILRILTGYLRPSEGTVRVADLDVVTRSREARARVGYVPEDVPLYEWMRVSEFLPFMARLRGLRGPAVGRAVEAAVERLALGGVRDLLIAKLSRGYRQRVAIAQALLGDPAVLVLDEPTNGLDPRQIIEMRGHIRGLAGAHTVLVTSHILGEIERVADRAAVLLAGRLLGVHRVRPDGRDVRLRVRVRGPLEVVRARLQAIPDVRAVTVESEPTPDVGTYLVESRTRPIADRVAAAVVGAGLGLLEMSAAPLDLEALFLELTGRAAGAGR
ncbi:MAG TPA: ABC transporter ATP-binding protein [Methylomirabilota bacterium]|nr:ABC transporter ATP-binding protein [Methylomirabilota bacterium]